MEDGFVVIKLCRQYSKRSPYQLSSGRLKSHHRKRYVKPAGFNYLGATASELALRSGALQQGTGLSGGGGLREKHTVCILISSQVGLLSFTPIFSLVCPAQLVFKIFYTF